MKSANSKKERKRKAANIQLNSCA